MAQKPPPSSPKTSHNMYKLSTSTSEEQLHIAYDPGLEGTHHVGRTDALSTWNLFCKFAPFLSLIPTTVISILVLVGNAKQWVSSPYIYTFIAANRATVQLVVQVVASILGFLNVFVICKVINYRTRLRLSVSSMSLDTLQFWNALLSRQLPMRLPVRMFIPLVTFFSAAVVPAALWAGAITPVAVVTSQAAFIQVPSYSNTTLLTLNWSSRTGLPTVSNNKGLFTYNVGERFLGPLLVAASTATTVDDSLRLNSKLDYTGFQFVGRSYGAGIAAGLTDASITTDPLAIYYTYQEPGYQAVVTCIHNSSGLFHLSSPWGIKEDTVNTFVAEGYLPNSGNQSEWSRYPSFSTDNIVAIGVATRPGVPRRILGIAAGHSYSNLNSTQCETQFVPTLFNVTVMLAGKNITVVPATNVSIKDIEPSGNLTFLANWQFTLMATDQTSLYTSLVGDSFNTSIQNYRLSRALRGDIPSDEDATAAGLANSVTGAMDGILGGYAAAQLMVANTTETATVWVGVRAIQFGQRTYIMAITIINIAVIIWVVFDAFQTKGWKALEDFDYMNPSDLVLGVAASYEGGAEKMLLRHSHSDVEISQRGPYFKLASRGWGSDDMGGFEK